MLIVYVPDITPRITYVLQQVFTQFLQVNYEVVNQPPVAGENNFVIYYTRQKGLCDLHIEPSGLLHEQHLQHPSPSIDVSGQNVRMFTNPSERFGFDVFSAIFWMLSRYEEYKPFTPDQHGRFPATASLAYQHGFISQPVVDQWVYTLKKLIEQKNKNLLPTQKFKQVNTIDVDNAYAYRGKGFVRQTGALFKHLLKGQWSELGQRLKVLRGKTTDPYDTYAYIRQTAEKQGVPTIFFHLVGELAAHDRNLPVQSPAYTHLLQDLNTWSVQGLHPSYRSNTVAGLVLTEKQELEKATGQKITRSRQHFLKLTFPHTYRQLVQAGIQEDYSMGFADHIGFRAGTGRAFTFFDLEANQEIPLTIQPLCIMEGTLRDYMHLSIEQAIQQVKQTRDQLKALDSTYVAVWHNETLGDYKNWKGWKKVYESQFG